MSRLGGGPEAIEGQVLVGVAADALQIAHAEIVESVGVLLCRSRLEALEGLLGLPLRQKQGAIRIKSLHVATVCRTLKKLNIIVLKGEQIPSEGVVVLLCERFYACARTLKVFVARGVVQPELLRQLGMDCHYEPLDRHAKLGVGGNALCGDLKQTRPLRRARIEQPNHGLRLLHWSGVGERGA